MNRPQSTPSLVYSIDNNIFGGESPLRIHYVLSDFDVLEVTKLDQLEQARTGCDRLILGLVSDEAFCTINSHPPLHPLADRLDLVAHLRMVDQVFPHVPGASLAFLGKDVSCFTTQPSYQELLGHPSEVLAPRRSTRSAFVPTLYATV